jgi:AraC-like DNA-binding protein
LHLALSVEQLADAVHLSPRQFSRAFLAETGQSPARAIEKLRVETARALIEDGIRSKGSRKRRDSRIRNACAAHFIALSDSLRRR